MTSLAPLHDLLDQSAGSRGAHIAVEELGGNAITYAELAELSDRLRDWLAAAGVSEGDRVGVYMTKSVDAVAAIFGVLKSGAAYVPVDPSSPASRNAFIFSDCAVKALVVESKFAGRLSQELAQFGALPPLLVVEGVGGGKPLRTALEGYGTLAVLPRSIAPRIESLSYILYTSGSTGRPKGVMINHLAARTFVDWCSDAFQPRADDRFSSHAPFHFDLSILDIYVSIKHGATLVLIDADVARDPVRLAPLIAEKRISIWYSAPSILGLLVQHGELARRDYASLRAVLFAGEVFPVVQLHALMRLAPRPRYFNLYGPTETNVCTYYEVPSTFDENRTDPYPIGKVCPHYRARVVDADGRDVAENAEGELCISGPGLMIGYWNQDQQTAAAFLNDNDGGPWYRTGDIVQSDAAGDYLFRGRRDRMVKRRGYRVELGEIEACLYQHPACLQVAVLSSDGEDGVIIKAFIATADGSRVSIIKLKQFCSERIPVYMVPDQFSFHRELPKTSTDKIDYQALKEFH